MYQKLFFDLLVLCGVFTGMFFFADILLPGFLSRYVHVGTLYIILLLLVITALHISSLSLTAQPPTKKMRISFMLIAIPLLYITTNNMPILSQIITITIIIILLNAVVKNTMH